MKIFLRVLKYLRRHPGLAAGTLICALASTAMVAVFPVVTQRIVDEVVRGGRADLLMPLVMIGLVSFLAQDGLNALRIVLNNTFEQRVIFDLRSDLYGHIQVLPLRWFDERATGDVMTRLIEDVTSVERVLIDGVEQGTVALLQVVVVLGIMLSYSPLLTGIAVLPMPLLAAGALAYTLTARNRYRLQRRAASALNALLHDNISGIRQIKAYADEERQHHRFNVASERLKQATLVVMRAWAIYQPSMSFLGSCGLLLIAGFGAWQVLGGGMDIGVLVAFLVLARFLYEPMGRLHQLNQIFQSGRAAGERVFEIMNEEPEGDDRSRIFEDRLMGDVRYENVSFAYREGIFTLQGITFHARPGEMVALVGPTGAGKSTVVSLLPRFYDYSGGRVFVDGVELREMARGFLRKNIGLVTQESFLFNGTIADNLRMGKAEATDEELWEALAAANAKGFVERLPERLRSEVGERGVRLSVGEKQRISIARALLKNPPILILDEATASVDTATERLIQEALERLLVNRTSFVIAHRLSTVRGADQILVLEHGRIVERGRHEELVEADGLYAHLVRIIQGEGTGSCLVG